jgi:hypothetical protein
MMPILVRQFIGVTTTVAQEVAYGGLWRLGVGATGVAGLQAFTRDGWGDEHQMSSDLELYERFTSASTSELVDEPGRVAERLVGRFVRGIGVDSWRDIQAALG